MSTLPDHVTIEIDGQVIEARKGSMIIEHTDARGIPVPRFCYHEKLSIAANCRMCLVDVEKSPKPVPACATPVMDGMKIYTRSKRALDAQRNVMEFLLINHPLDCPICDQGGECELQDVAMGYGRSVSRYSERKRVVADEDLGPLVATDMTRCIHCTRCVRYLTEIAGSPELGGIGRGEHLEIGTFIGRNLSSELSAGVIDVCPVGALTNKVFRYRARAWELVAKPSIGFHDALGGNLYLHVRRGEVLRAVPRDNPAINACWASDRDRFAHQGLSHEQRLRSPMVRRDGQWHPLAWPEAIAAAVGALKSVSGDGLAMLVAPWVSCEEGLLLKRLAEGIGCPHLDHRLRQIDFHDDGARPPPAFSAPLDELERAPAVLLLGCRPRFEAPLLGVRLRQAQRAGGALMALGLCDDDQRLLLARRLHGNPQRLVALVLGLLRASGDGPLPAALAARLAEAPAIEAADAAELAAMAESLRAPGARILFGLDAVRHPQASLLRAAARALAARTGAGLDEIPDGANAHGLHRVGVLPGSGGRNVRAQLETGAEVVLLYGAEAADFALGQALDATLGKAREVIACAAYADPELLRRASLLLPIALPPESDATMVNALGIAQRIAAAVAPPGDTRPGWKLLRVLGEALGVAGFSFVDHAEIAADVATLLDAPPARVGEPASLPAVPAPAKLALVRRLGIYAGDPVLRRCPALQATPLAESSGVWLHPADAEAAGIGANGRARLGEVELPARLCASVPRGSIMVSDATPETAALPPTGTVIAASS